MYYVITKEGVHSASSLEKINNAMDAKLESEEFYCYGPDKVARLDDVDIDFVRDKKKMSAIAFQNFFMKDTRPTFYFCIELVVLFIIMVAVFSK